MQSNFRLAAANAFAAIIYGLQLQVGDAISGYFSVFNKGITICTNSLYEHGNFVSIVNYYNECDGAGVGNSMLGA
jgi:hypothetical protein